MNTEESSLFDRISDYRRANEKVSSDSLWTTTVNPPITTVNGHVDILEQDGSILSVFFDTPNLLQEETLTYREKLTTTPFQTDVIIRIRTSGNKLKLHVDTTRKNAERVCAVIRSYTPSVEAYKVFTENERYGFLFWVVGSITIPKLVHNLIHGLSMDPSVVIEGVAQTNSTFEKTLNERLMSPPLTSDAAVSFPDHDDYYKQWLTIHPHELNTPVWIIPSSMPMNQMFSHKFIPDLPKLMIFLSSFYTGTSLTHLVKIYGVSRGVVEDLCLLLDLIPIHEDFSTDTIEPTGIEYHTIAFIFENLNKLNELIAQSSGPQSEDALLSE